MRYGYVREDPLGADVDQQRLELASAGCQIIIEDDYQADSRGAELTALLATLRAGDELTVVGVGYLDRTSDGMVLLLQDLAYKGVTLLTTKALGIDFNDLSVRALVSELAALITSTRELAHTRQRRGIEAALAAGRNFGRPSKLSSHEVTNARYRLASGDPVRQVAKQYGVSEATLRRHCRRKADEC